MTTKRMALWAAVLVIDGAFIMALTTLVKEIIR